MRLVLGLIVAAGLVATGCGVATDNSGGGSTTPAATGAGQQGAVPGTSAVANDAPVASAAAGAAAAADPPAAAPNAAQPVSGPLMPLPLEGGTAILKPENTKIEFVGTHLPPKQPDPRTGGFEKFTGKLEVDPAAKALKSASIEIDATSLWTEIGGRLTEHLKSADFLEVREYPTIKFESTKIEALSAGEGSYQITGNLALHGVTKAISCPATAVIGVDGLTLKSQFNIDRHDFGISWGPDQVVNKVLLTVVVGEKTQPRQGGGGFGGFGGGKGKRGPGGGPKRP